MIRTKRNCVLIAMLGVLASATTGYAAPITVFNTGVDAFGSPQTHGSTEIHYALIATADTTTAVQVLTASGGFPIGPWLGDNSVSAWIGPDTDDDSNGPVGTYTYRTTFSLAGLDAASALLSGQWAADNWGTDIIVNGVSTSQTAGGFGSWDLFSINSGLLLPGFNTLDFVTTNAGGPTGLRVEFLSATADPLDVTAVPEPASMILVGSGLATLVYRRRNKASIK